MAVLVSSELSLLLLLFCYHQNPNHPSRMNQSSSFLKLYLTIQPTKVDLPLSDLPEHLKPAVEIKALWIFVYCAGVKTGWLLYCFLVASLFSLLWLRLGLSLPSWPVNAKHMLSFQWASYWVIKRNEFNMLFQLYVFNCVILKAKYLVNSVFEGSCFTIRHKLPAFVIKQFLKYKDRV